LFLLFDGEQHADLCRSTTLPPIPIDFKTSTSGTQETNPWNSACLQQSNSSKTKLRQPTPEEFLQDQQDSFERGKTWYLSHSFVMFDMQYGIDLDTFVQTLDPLQQYKTLRALSQPSMLRSTSKTKQRDFVSNVWREVAKYRVNICSAALQAGSSGASPSIYISNSDLEYPVVIDSGASFSLTPKIEDFITPLQVDKTILTGLNSTSVVAGSGAVEWTIQDVSGIVRKIRVEAFYVPQASIRLFSPQQYFQENQAGSYYMEANHSSLILTCGTELRFPYNSGNRLPLMLTKQFCERHVHVAGLSFEEVDYLANASIDYSTNQNLTGSQRELLLWHWKLGHIGMKWVQSLGSVPKSTEVRSKPVIPTRAGSQMSSCERPLCTACQLSKQSRRTRAGAKQRTGGQDMPFEPVHYVQENWSQ